MKARILKWLLLRAAGPRLAPEVERILSDRVCTVCGSWRCPECQFLILTWWDHHSRCSVGDRQKASET